MQDNKPKYWRGIEELENTPEFVKNAYNEFPEYLPVLNNKSEEGASSAMPTADRREFLKLMGFSVAAATLASCEAPVRKAIPYLNKPEEIEPGIANWYASTYFDGGDYNAVLVKTREGRPIKLEGNPMSVTGGGLSARAQASVLNLYDDARLKGPVKAKKQVTWEEMDRAVTAGLGQGGRVVLVSNTIISPSTKKVINEFLGKFGGEHVTYDANSYSAISQAYEASHGKRMIPSYDFSKPEVIVSVGADFINTWLNPVEQARQYITKRKVSSDNRKMSKHYQFETMMTVTGANADVRVPVRPSEEAAVVAALHNRIAGGSTSVPAMAKADKQIEKAAAELMAARGAALVVSGSKDAAVQLMVNQINTALGAFGTVIDISTPTYTRQGNDQQMMNFINNMSGIGTVIFYNANPVYDHPMGAQIAAGIKNIATSISFSDREDETATLCKFICPDHNYLESWNDYEPKKGFLSLAQPTISPLFNTRQAQDSLLVWTGNNTDYYTYLQRNWRGILSGSFVSAWDKAVHDGVYQAGAGYSSIFDTVTSTGGGSIAPLALSSSKDIEVSLYETASLGNGTHANNPWLLEMADPITRACWDNFVCMSQAMSKGLGLEQGNMVKVTAKNGKASVTLPVLIQPGMPDNAIAMAIGYGRTHAGPAAKQVGGNVYPFAQANENGVRFINTVSLEKTGENKEIAQIQTHHTLMGRIVVQDSTLAKYQKDPKSVTERIRISTPLDPSGTAAPSEVSLWKDYDYKNHHWGMVIDLNSCIGCGSCTLGCQAENNVP
ncbi:MAG: molybdopterin oxidoreductase, partial [Sphingobacteriales bacterium]